MLPIEFNFPKDLCEQAYTRDDMEKLVREHYQSQLLRKNGEICDKAVVIKGRIFRSTCIVTMVGFESFGFLYPGEIPNLYEPELLLIFEVLSAMPEKQSGFGTYIARTNSTTWNSVSVPSFLYTCTDQIGLLRIEYCGSLSIEEFVFSCTPTCG